MKPLETEEETRASDRFALIQKLGLEYSAEFIPFSKSRNAKEKRPSLNWKVTIKRGNRSLTTDYMQGYGHIPVIRLAKGNTSVTKDRYVRLVCEMGRYSEQEVSFEDLSFKTKTLLPKPELQDVLYSLVMDANALDYPNFEQWASDYGYEEDSRSAEKIYRACLSTGLELRALIGNDALEKLRDLYQDY